MSDTPAVRASSTPRPLLRSLATAPTTASSDPDFSGSTGMLGIYTAAGGTDHPEERLLDGRELGQELVGRPPVTQLCLNMGPPEDSLAINQEVSPS